MKALFHIVIYASIALTFTKVNGQSLSANNVNFETKSTSSNKFKIKNDFRKCNTILVKQNKVKFSREIKNAKLINDTLNYISENKKISLPLYRYIKVLRKSANNSENHSEFQNAIIDALPELEMIFSKEKNIDLLYDNLRKNTFYGKLDRLPAFL